MSVPAWKSDRPSRRSALKTPPLRLPGQSTDGRIASLYEYVDDYLTYALCFLVIAWYQWFQWLIERPVHPIVFTFAAIAVIGFSIVRIRSLKSDIRNLQMGNEGERVVANVLDPLREKGYRVFHDIPGPGFNIDHVIVGPGGVFAVETKTRTKPMRGRATVIHDGNTLRIENGRPFDEPLNQARAQAHWLADRLNDGRRGALFTVRPVVVFPEWFVERQGSATKSDVWVLNPKALGSFLDHEPCILSGELIDTAAHTLSVHSRQSYKATA